MIKITVLAAILAIGTAVSVRSAYTGPGPAPAPATTPTTAPASAPAPAPAPAPAVPRPDITAMLADGTTSNASGDNAVAAAADTESGAVGAKGEDAAFGLAGPGLAIGGGAAFAPSAASETPSIANIFSIFN